MDIILLFLAKPLDKHGIYHLFAFGFLQPLQAAALDCNVFFEKHCKLQLKMQPLTYFLKLAIDVFSNCNVVREAARKIDDSAKEGLTQFWELFTMILCALRYLKR